jgi:hypothetical protein
MAEQSKIRRSITNSVPINAPYVYCMENIREFMEFYYDDVMDYLKRKILIAYNCIDEIGLYQKLLE